MSLLPVHTVITSHPSVLLLFCMVTLVTAPQDLPCQSCYYLGISAHYWAFFIFKGAGQNTFSSPLDTESMTDIHTLLLVLCLSHTCPLWLSYIIQAKKWGGESKEAVKKSAAVSEKTVLSAREWPYPLIHKAGVHTEIGECHRQIKVCFCACFLWFDSFRSPGLIHSLLWAYCHTVWPHSLPWRVGSTCLFTLRCIGEWAQWVADTGVWDQRGDVVFFRITIPKNLRPYFYCIESPRKLLGPKWCVGWTGLESRGDEGRELRQKSFEWSKEQALWLTSVGMMWDGWGCCPVKLCLWFCYGLLKLGMQAKCGCADQQIEPYLRLPA